MSSLEPNPATTPAAEWTTKTLAALDHASIDPASPISGATAQTSGFAQAGFDQVPPSSGFGGGLSGGGLASSPNVPRPGTSIDPSTGKPHTAGLTRAELAGIKAKGAGLLDPTPQTEAVKVVPVTEAKSPSVVTAGDEAAATKHHERSLEELSGREQAARQLAGIGAPAPEENLSGNEQAARQLASKSAAGEVPVASDAQTASGLITPGLELPGGWGPVAPVVPPGHGPNATSSIYSDVGNALQSVGTAAYSAIPGNLKDALSTHSSSGAVEPVRSTNTTTTIPAGQPGTLDSFLEQAKAQASKVVGQVEGTFTGHGHPSSTTTSVERSPDQTGGVGGIIEQAKAQAEKVAHQLEETFERASDRVAAVGTEGSVIDQFKGYLGGVLPSSVVGEKVVEPQHPAHSTAVASATSLPSNETAGALPGAHSGGVGALPGAAGEANVALLPLEKQNPEDKILSSPKASTTTSSLPETKDLTGVPVLPAGTSPVQSAVPTSAARSETLTQSSDPLPLPKSSDLTGAPVLPSGNTQSAITASQIPSLHGSSDLANAPPLSDDTNTFASTQPKEPTVSETSRSTAFGSYGGLAPALPQTNLGLGADRGATETGLGPGKVTDVESTRTAPASSEFSSGKAAGLGALGAGAGAAAVAAHSSAGQDFLRPAGSGNAPDTRHSADRTTSSASVTAIRGGHEGEHPVLDGIGEDSSSSIGQKSTTRGTGPKHTTSLTPGIAEAGVGHPVTRDVEGTSRQPASYPVVDHSAPHTSIDNAANHNVVDTTPSKDTFNSKPLPAVTPSQTHETGNIANSDRFDQDLDNKPFPNTTDEFLEPTVRMTGGATGVANNDHLPTSSQSGAPAESHSHSGVSPSSTSAGNGTTVGSGHRRTESDASAKKKGLFSKIKDKMKNI